MTSLVIGTDGSGLTPFGNGGTSDYGDTFIATQSTLSSVTFYAEGIGSSDAADVRVLVVPTSGLNFTSPIFTGAAQLVTVGLSPTSFTLSLNNTAVTVGHQYAVVVEDIGNTGASSWTFQGISQGSDSQEAVWYNAQPQTLPSSGTWASAESWWDEQLSLEMTLNYGTVVAPTVTIASTGGDVNQATQTISGTVDVADAGSTVYLYDNSSATALGSAVVQSNGSWSASVTLVSGNNVIVAKDANAGGTGSSSAVTYNLNTTPPTVTLALAHDTGSSATDKITNNDALTGTAAANSNVVIKNGATTLATVAANASGVWSYTPTGLADGAHTLTASQTDAWGNTGTASLTFTLDTTAPVVTEALTTDTSGGSKVTYNDALSGTAEANATVSISIDGGAAVAATANASGAWSYTPASLADGAHSVVASETDVAGNTGSSSALTFTLDTHTPAATIGLTTDTSGGSKITYNDALSGTADKNATVRLSIDGGAAVNVTANASGAWSYTPAGLANGAHTVTIIDADTAGKSSTASTSFTFDTHTPDAPAITGASDVVSTSISGAATVAVLSGNTVAVSGTMDEADGTVTLFSGGVAIGSSAVDGHGKFAINANAPATGSETLTAKFTDTAGIASPLSNAVTLVVDAGPSVAAGSLTIGHGKSQDVTALLNSLIANGEPGDSETVSSNSASLVRNAQGHWIYTAPNAGGSDAIGFTVANQLGETRTGSVTVTVDAGPSVANGSVNVAAGSVSDITSYVDSLITAGLPGDAETITSQSANLVQNAQGDWILTAPTTGASETVGFTVTDQYGDSKTGSLNVQIAHASDVVYLQGYNNSVTGPNAPTTMSQTAGANLVGPFFGNWNVTGPANDVTITGRGYSNTINAGGGNDTIYGGLSNATVTVSDFNGNNTVLGNVAGDEGSTIVALGDGDNTINLVGYDNTITLGNGDNTVTAGLGGEVVKVGDGNNTIDISGAQNAVWVGSGNNTITVGGNNDSVTVAGGTADIVANGYYDNFTINGGNVAIDGPVGLSTITLGSSFDLDDSVDVTSFFGALQDVGGVWSVLKPDGEVFAKIVPPSNDSLQAVSDGHGGMTITLGASPAPSPSAPSAPTPTPAPGFGGTITETAGSQSIVLGSGTTTLKLWGYDNHVSSADGGFTISGDAGSSTFDLAQGGNTLLLGGQGDAIRIGVDGSGHSIATGNNTISGTVGGTTVVIGNGDQNISLGGAYNHIVTGVGDSTINAGAGYSTVTVAGSNNAITAAGNDNVVATGSGNDTVMFGAGWNNTVIAGSGVTTVAGGYGDTYVAGTGTLHVTDFNAAYGDVLDLTGLETNLGVTASAFSVAADATDASALDVFVTGAHGATTLVASLHGANGTMASLLASHAIHA